MLTHNLVDEKTLRQYSPLVLAYVGDAVFELAVRTRIAGNGPRRLRDLHHEAVATVNADRQAAIVRQMEAQLNQEELDIVRRGRNTRSHPPKNADVQSYRMSTGFEALLGYLYLKGEHDRLDYLLHKALEEI
ncbi:MAG TPA: ribonuclease III domain-containing protein [Syntrophomonas sp.]|nr:ribonuclease III domain-containing protein [Syntrophomonas sp.]HRW11701.1 ribonuclease III domain-containing protein [Syntrophomonas sp.]